MTRGLFSVIIPVFNTERFLRRAVDSVLKQSYPLFEIILVDDGSTDGSGTICDQYASTYDCCQVIHQSNRGLAAARNAGLRAAKGEYICFLDADDFIEKVLLTRVSVELEKGAEVCSFAARRVDEEEKFLYELRFDSLIGTRELTKENRKDFIRNHICQYEAGWEACFQAFRADVIFENQIYFDETVKIAEDKLFTLSYLQKVKKWIAIPDILYNYTMRKESLTKGGIREGLVDQGNTEFLHLKEILPDAGEWYLDYLGILFYYYKLRQKDVPLEQLTREVQQAKEKKLQDEMFSLALNKKRQVWSCFGKERGDEMLDLISRFRKG